MAGCAVLPEYGPLEAEHHTARNVEHTLGSVARQPPPGREMMNLPQYVRQICGGFVMGYKARCIGQALLISETRRNNVAAVILTACTREDGTPDERVICFDKAITVGDNDLLKLVRMECNHYGIDFSNFGMEVLEAGRPGGTESGGNEEDLSTDGILASTEWCYNHPLTVMGAGRNPFNLISGVPVWP